MLCCYVILLLAQLSNQAQSDQKYCIRLKKSQVSQDIKMYFFNGSYTHKIIPPCNTTGYYHNTTN